MGRDTGGPYRTLKLCKLCGQPMKPKGAKKKPNEYDHARGCPYSRTNRVTAEDR